MTEDPEHPFPAHHARREACTAAEWCESMKKKPPTVLAKQHVYFIPGPNGIPVVVDSYEFDASVSSMPSIPVTMSGKVQWVKARVTLRDRLRRLWDSFAFLAFGLALFIVGLIEGHAAQ